jgi:hypothetical protein
MMRLWLYLAILLATFGICLWITEANAAPNWIETSDLDKTVHFNATGMLDGEVCLVTCKFNLKNGLLNLSKGRTCKVTRASDGARAIVPPVEVDWEIWDGYGGLEGFVELPPKDAGVDFFPGVTITWNRGSMVPQSETNTKHVPRKERSNEGQRFEMWGGGTCTWSNGMVGPCEFKWRN